MIHLFGRRALVLALAIGLALFMRDVEGVEAERVFVVTSISPLADIIRGVGGDRVQVTNLVAVGADPHSFQPSPQDVLAVSRAQVFFANGLGEEKYLNALVSNAGNPNLTVVVLSDGLPLLEKGGPNAEFAATGNPHVWLDPTYVVLYVQRIRDTLSQVDPDGGATYEANSASYVARLRALDDWVASVVQTIPSTNRTLVTFHDAWPYFCSRYGLSNVPLVSASAEAQPSARDYAALMTLIRAKRVPAVFGEAGFNPKLVQRLAADTGAAFVSDLLDDTLGSDEATNSYLKMMVYDAQKIVTALGGTVSSLPSF